MVHVVEGRGGGLGGRVGLARSADGFDWVRDSGSPVFGAGEPGQWDETNVVSDDILKIDDTYYFFYHGYGASEQTGFWGGMATSPDLHHWIRYPYNPISAADTVMALQQGSEVSLYLMDAWEGGLRGVSRFEPFIISAPRLYVDGQEETYWRRMDTGSKPIAADTLELQMGMAVTHDPRPFEGIIDELRLYRRALGPLELSNPWEDLTASSGGAVALEAGSRPTFIGCSLVGNFSAGDGGALFAIEDSRPALLNCTIAANGIGTGMGMAVFAPDGAALQNCIVWNNHEADRCGALVGAADVSYSNIQGGWEGPGNINADPLFLHLDRGDVRLRADSPCIDGGDPGMQDASYLSDLGGHERFMCGRIDMGAYEYGSGDYNCDRRVDAGDYWTFADCAAAPQGRSPAVILQGP